MADDALLTLTSVGSVRFDEQLVEAARRAMSPNSWRALKADLRIFGAWASKAGHVSFPSEPKTIAAFIREQAEHGKKAATLSRYVSSISRLHSLGGFADPTRAELVRLELKAQRRALGVRQRQAMGLRFRGEVADPVHATNSVGVCVEAMLAAAPETLQGKRDRALLSLAFDTGLRRSEIVATRWPHYEKGSASSGRLFVPRSKADQEGSGAYAFLSARTVEALDEWRAAAQTQDGPIFRRLHRSRTKGYDDVWTVGAGLTAQSVTLIYRALLEAADEQGLLGPIDQTELAAWRRGLTAHSTRVGLTQDLFASGEDLGGIMQALRWKSSAQPARYSQALAVEANAAARVVSKL